MTDSTMTTMMHNRGMRRRNKYRYRRGRAKFITAYLRAPRNVGSVVPSSRFLSRKIAAQVDPHHPGWVIELGAGTGTVTRALLDAGVKPERLLVVERDRRLCAHLNKQFAKEKPRIVRADAVTLEEIIANENIHKVSAVVCCLPLLSLPKNVHLTVVEQIFRVLPEGGKMVQFTYGPRSPVNRRLLKQLGVEGKRVGRVLLNVPPASVWCYTGRK